MKLILVGGQTRNIGKTSVVEGIVRATAALGWTAVKITQYGHGVSSKNGKARECEVSERAFSITEESVHDSGTDTSRFLAAGARRALWLRTKQGELKTALAELKKRIADDQFVIVESNSLRRFIEPLAYLQVLDTSNPDFKVSAHELFSLSDAYVLTGDAAKPALPRNAALLAGEIQRDKPLFDLRDEDGFTSPDMIQFVRERLQLANSPS